MSCPEKDDSDSDSTETTLKLGYLKKQLIVEPAKSCLKKNSSIDEYSSLVGQPTISPESIAKRSSGNKSNRISLKFAEDTDRIVEVKGFSYDCLSLNKRTMSSDMELNIAHGLRNNLKRRAQPKSQMIPYKNSKADIKLEDFILEEVEEEELSVCRTITEIPKKPNRLRSSSSILSKLRERIAPEKSD